MPKKYVKIQKYYVEQKSTLREQYIPKKNAKISTQHALHMNFFAQFHKGGGAIKSTLSQII